MPPKQGQLLVYQKYVDLINYSYNLLQKFPKAEKYAMVAHLKDSMFTALKVILQANKVYNNQASRIERLNSLDAEVQLQKVLVRLAHQNRYISNSNYMEWSRRLDEIGRLLGGWIRQTVGKNI
ncbi:diversity-generating retroelement protein Avd [Pelotomaculum propionicicum]|uniref:bAvd-like domain-containing protein n=1 Tax=Pelotomaculum propionicicum TaxID=258475 RepID=A0A4Y7RBJ3_9FIRM|nr:diversity-generating retroelement protein Avd [Pelotomaculum propionicicum]TEB06385.1 hypothetical protein Pmgp_03761 [Pelotomaculum propionicicum]